MSDRGLWLMNRALRGVDRKLRMKQRSGIPTFYFVVGAPRSGTTLLTQILAHCYGLGYITNLAARFWLAPLVGIRLSKLLLGNDPSAELGTGFFRSQHARTSGFGGIHEFGRFWVSHFGDCSEWIGTNRHIISPLLVLGREFGTAGVVMKGIYPAYQAARIKAALGSKAVFVNIEREFTATCDSVLKARRDRFGTDRAWFGWKLPIEQEKQILAASPGQQITYQVAWFQRYYRGIADHTIKLEDLCSEPYMALAEAMPTLPRLLPVGALRGDTR